MLKCILVLISRATMIGDRAHCGLRAFGMNKSSEMEFHIHLRVCIVLVLSLLQRILIWYFRVHSIGNQSAPAAQHWFMKFKFQTKSDTNSIWCWLLCIQAFQSETIQIELMPFSLCIQIPMQPSDTWNRINAKFWLSHDFSKSMRNKFALWITMKFRLITIFYHVGRWKTRFCQSTT